MLSLRRDTGSGGDICDRTGLEKFMTLSLLGLAAEGIFTPSLISSRRRRY